MGLVFLPLVVIVVVGVYHCWHDDDRSFDYDNY